MPSYIFVTDEGFTFSPDPCAVSPDVVNMQVLGFASGDNPQAAFSHLASENPELLESAFDEVQCIELKHDWIRAKSCRERANWFSLSDLRESVAEA